VKKKSGRAISDEERALFEATLKNVKRLNDSHAPRLILPAKPVPKAPSLPAKIRPQAETEAPVIGGHVAAKLRRGRAKPEARLDLHGFYEGEAHLALERFLGRAQGEGKSLVLVITGKSGVLYRNVPRWLSEEKFRGFVSGTAPAHIRHGGAGALYITLKRKR